jgi:uncharacterized protein
LRPHGFGASVITECSIKRERGQPIQPANFPALVLNEEQFDALAAWLEQRPAGIKDILELEGFLTAVVIGPNRIDPAVWLPVVWGGYVPDSNELLEFGHFGMLVLGLHNELKLRLNRSSNEFEPTFYEIYLDDEPIPVVDGWCSGFLHGVHLDTASWRALTCARPDLLKLMLRYAGRTDLKARQNDRECVPKIASVVRAIHAFWLPRRLAVERRIVTP